ncbi:hypothetical protein Psal006b_00460 [Piscirickettsia salmonis]|uniref:TrfA n=1 Tax=Piscirickettsia salmonis TaxID=1238 RepID=A0A1L6TEN4_PISSA|nr:hypothetical protein [Piscirickettsia salmonis]AKP72613.2 hypothetical protein PSLF89_467 [Piscirickettsia salmonis LF-89 = ATCC VR-1361]ALB23899.1 TrfA [Piscirickettsia salmonis]ALY03730.1 hypothetical protein AWE47_13395 [Piscirickettsia salmonis]AMA43292.1 hypothetical protein AWJ11_13620 [Piscirickettsia salmonis]AOS35762.1 hypothetical protein AVM72_10740 [Piscirickettsia salmonis]
MPVSQPVWAIQTSTFRVQSSLYSIKNKANQRRIYNQEQIPSIGPYHIILTGEELLQYDLAVLYSIIHKGQQTNPTANKINISIAEILQALQSSDGSSQRKAIHRSIERNAQMQIYLQSAHKNYQFNQIEFFDFNKITKNYSITLAKEHFELEKAHPCQINLFTRNALAQGLTSWLYGFIISSTEQALQLSMDQLRILCGAEIKNHYAFKGCVARSIEILQKINLIEANWAINQQNILQLTRKQPTNSLQNMPSRLINLT